MALIRITSDGVEFEIPDEIAEVDRLIREALAPYYADMANADIKRTDKNGRAITDENGRTVIEVTKRAGTKGAKGNIFEVIDALLAAPEEINPALVVHFELMEAEKKGKLSLRRYLGSQGDIRRAAAEGKEQLEANKNSLDLLRGAIPVPAETTPAGF